MLPLKPTSVARFLPISLKLSEGVASRQLEDQRTLRALVAVSVSKQQGAHLHFHEKPVP